MAGMAAFSAELVYAYLWPAPRQPEFDCSLRIETGTLPALRVVALGDSTFTAPGVERAEEVWIRPVLRHLAEATGRTLEFESMAAGGSTSTNVLAQQLPRALASRPDVVFLSVGANDLIRGMPTRRLEQNLDEIVGALRRQGAEVVMSGVGDLGTIPRLAPPLRQMASRLGRRGDRVHARVAQRHDAIKADQWRWAAGEFRRRRDVWSADRFHPNAAGHRIWARVGLDATNELLQRLPNP